MCSGRKTSSDPHGRIHIDRGTTCSRRYTYAYVSIHVGGLTMGTLGVLVVALGTYLQRGVRGHAACCAVRHPRMVQPYSVLAANDSKSAIPAWRNPVRR